MTLEQLQASESRGLNFARVLLDAQFTGAEVYDAAFGFTWSLKGENYSPPSKYDEARKDVSSTWHRLAFESKDQRLAFYAGVIAAIEQSETASSLTG